MFTGSTGREPKGEPKDAELKLTGSQPVPSAFLYVEDAEQWYVQPVGRIGRLSPPHWLPRVVEVAVGSGMDTYVIDAVPSEPDGESTLNRLSARFIVSMSDILWESLPCLSISAGLRVIMTNTESMAIMETTTRSSMRVKLERENNQCFKLGLCNIMIILL